MYFAASEMSVAEVLSAFHRDAPYLFLGAAFVAVGLVSAAFAAIRRKRDSLLIFFALFAAFYGLRLWIWSNLLGMTVQGSTFYARLRAGVNYIHPHSRIFVLHRLGSAKTIRPGGWVRHGGSRHGTGYGHLPVRRLWRL